jgi:hypothetical protein
MLFADQPSGKDGKTIRLFDLNCPKHASGKTGAAWLCELSENAFWPRRYFSVD